VVEEATQLHRYTASKDSHLARAVAASAGLSHGDSKDSHAAMEEAVIAQQLADAEAAASSARGRKARKTKASQPPVISKKAQHSRGATSARVANDAEEAMMAAAIAASMRTTPLERAVGSSSTSEALKLARAAQAEADEAYARSLQQRLNRGRVGAPVVSSRLYRTPAGADPSPRGGGAPAARFLKPKGT